MSYTTRRTGGVPGNQQAPSVGNIGQRRPVVTNNFVPGGTVTPAQAKGVNQQQQQRQPAGQTNTTIHFRNQQQQQQQVQIKPEPQQPPPQQTFQGQKQQPQTPAQVQPQPRPPQPQPVERINNPPQQQPEQNVVQAPPPQGDQKPKVENVQQLQQQSTENGDEMEVVADQVTGVTENPPPRRRWFRRNLPRREMIRRRNFNLSKLLKPKNALAILNEIVKNLTYEVENISNRTDGRTFKASVLYDELVHEGFGFTEDQAKNGAAEVVLKHYIKSNKTGETKKNDDGTEKMEVSTPDDENAHVPLPWQHVASFAIYKLFSQWEEDPSLVGISASYLNVKQETKSSKKMPPNPETINPLMLLNQMMPQAKFEEIGRSGNPPQVIFSFKCIVDSQTFIGSGTSKKIAKRNAAFEACHKLLGVTYPPDVFVPADVSMSN